MRIPPYPLCLNVHAQKFDVSSERVKFVKVNWGTCHRPVCMPLLSLLYSFYTARSIAAQAKCDVCVWTVQ